MNPQMKSFLIIAGLSGAMSVVLGAFGAHGLKGKLEPNLMNAYLTGVEYQFYHTFAILAVAILCGRYATPLLQTAGVIFTLGIMLFSGSLYVMAFTGITRLGIITPIGGLLLLAGWLCLTGSALRAVPQ